MFFSTAPAAGIAGGLACASCAYRLLLLIEESEDAVLFAARTGARVAQHAVVASKTMFAMQNY